MSPSAPQPRRLVVLGSTGSIGVNTLDVVAHLNGPANHAPGETAPFQLAGLAAGRNVDKLVAQARRFGVPAVAVADPVLADQVRAALPGVSVFAGGDGPRQLVRLDGVTDVVAAIVGSAGLPAVMEAAQRGLRIALANKETLVAAGALVTPLVRARGGALLPVDSEHSAVFQCLQGRSHPIPEQTGRDTRAHGSSPEPQAVCPGLDARHVKRIVLTASGGPFRNTSAADMAQATVDQALAHPTWNMGPKISIDSATMMNKALEIIEAHWLFGLPGDRIQVIVHPQSVVHSFVEFEDHSVLAQMGPPDMRTPIQYALTWPGRRPGCSQPMDWSKLRGLEFTPPDLARFPALKLAYEVIEAGGTSGAVLNAANETAVAAFLERRIRFGRIVELVQAALSALPPVPADCLDTVLRADRQARDLVTRLMAAE